jgi:hypothetical protein
MKLRQTYLLALLACLGVTPGLWAQIPAAPVVPIAPVAAAPVAAAPVAAAPPAPAPANLWSFLCPDLAKLAACKAMFCASPLGQLVNGMLAPASALSGGIINCCPPNLPNAADLAKPADTPAGAAARIKADEAAAKARREAVQYLATVDCHRWPEAEDALITALRVDRNECVRLEAAWALGRGCCCTRKTLVALSITVAGSGRDGNPTENSERVKAAAAASLAHCLACLADVVPLTLEPPTKVPVKEGPREGPKEGPEKLTATPATYYEQVQKAPLQDVVSVARRTLEKANVPIAPNPAPEMAHGGAFNIIVNAVAANGTRTSGSAAVAHRENAGPVQAVTADQPREGLLPMLARRFAPTPLNEDQPEGSQFQNPPFFLRKPYPEQVVTVANEPAKHQGARNDAMPTMAAPTAKTAQGAVASSSPKPVVPPTPVSETTAVAMTTPVTLVNIPSMPVVPPPPTPVGKTASVALPPAPLASSAKGSSLIVPQVSSAAMATSITMGGPNPASAPSPVPGSGPKQPSNQVVQMAYSSKSPYPARPTTASGAPRPEFPKYVGDLIATLEHGKACEEALGAAFSLANCPWKTHPQVVEALTTAARINLMVPVRVTAIRCLASLHVTTPNVRATLQALKDDRDPMVRTEAEQALNSFVFFGPTSDSHPLR